MLVVLIRLLRSCMDFNLHRAAFDVGACIVLRDDRKLGLSVFWGDTAVIRKRVRLLDLARTIKSANVFSNLPCFLFNRMHGDVSIVELFVDALLLNRALGLHATKVASQSDRILLCKLVCFRGHHAVSLFEDGHF